MKAQMRFQKIMCLIMLILGALAVVYACCYLTGSMSDLFTCLETDTVNGGWQEVSASYTSDGVTYTLVGVGAMLYVDIQDFNDTLLWLGIIIILAAVVLYITSTNKRRKYYITNYIATGVVVIVDVVISIVAMVMNASWKSKFLDINFEQWESCYNYYTINKRTGAITYSFRSIYGVEYSDSTVMFDLGFVLYAIIIVASLLLVFNLVWKYMNEKQEKKLLGGSVAGKTAEVTAL